MPRQSVTHLDSAAGFGERLREARRAAGLRQHDLSFAGCSSGYVSLLEGGRRIPSLQVVRELARRLGVSEQWLATGEAAARPESDVRLEEAEFALRLDDVEHARAVFEQLADRDGEPVGVHARARAGLGQLAFRSDDARAAITHLEAVYALVPEFADPAAAETLGRAYGRVGEEELAIALFRRQLERARSEHDEVNQLRFAVLLANALIDAAQFGEAAQILGDALAEQRSLDSMALARLYWSQSRLHAARGETESAARFARRAVSMLEATEHTLYTARAYQMLAHIELDAGHTDEALEVLARGRELLANLGTDYDRATYAVEEARALALSGRFGEAAALAMEAAHGFNDAHPVDAGRSFTELAAAFEQSGDVERAAEIYELAIELLERRPHRHLAEAYARYGSLLDRQGKRDAAYDVFKRGATLRAALERGAGV